MIQLEKVFWVKNQTWSILPFGFMYWIPMTLKNMVFWIHNSQIKLNGTDALGGVYRVDRLWMWGIFWFRVVVSWYVVCMMLFVPPASFLQASAVLHSKFTNIVASYLRENIFNFPSNGIPANSCIMCGLTLTSCVCLFFRSQL